MTDNNKFRFEFSLSVLNDLGRNLYRNFITVLGEAISNSWDADADNVWINIDKDGNSFVIKDDGDGMSARDFQDKFLKIGYSKRGKGERHSQKNRPYIGSKGIGKLALLSCARKISIISKTSGSNYEGGVIDNLGLDDAIKKNVDIADYQLGAVDHKLFDPYVKEHHKGTIIHFEKTNEEIRNTIPYLKKLIALYFRFSLLDESFNIFVNGEKVTLDDLKDLSNTTEFLWSLNNYFDPYFKTLSKLKNQQLNINSALPIRGFIATVEKPRDLMITGTGQKIGVDLFANGRLRERNLLGHIPTARIAENYIYGQIHFDELDSDDKDRFTTSREGVLLNDDKFQRLLEELKNLIIPQVLDEWDNLRLSRDEYGDDENVRKTKKERKALSLYNLSSKDFSDPNDDEDEEVSKWIKELQPDAIFNIQTYVDCFISENLVRKYILEKNISVSSNAQTEITEMRRVEANHKRTGNINIGIRQNNEDLSYLDMNELVILADRSGIPNTLRNDAKEYRPIRNALMHTALLTEEAKSKLTTVYSNIKARIKTLLS